MLYAVLIHVTKVIFAKIVEIVTLLMSEVIL